MIDIPINPKNTGKFLSKFPINMTVAATTKIIPINSAIFCNNILHMLIAHICYIGFLLNANERLPSIVTFLIKQNSVGLNQ
jgi:hypothetical protein